MKLSDVKNLNRRRIFRRYYVRDGIRFRPDSLEIEVENLTSQGAVTVLENYPGTVYDGEPVLELRSEPLPASVPKRVFLRFPSPCDLSGEKVFCFGFNGRTECTLLEVALVGSCGEREEYALSVFSERWNVLLLELGEGEVLKSVSGVEFCLRGFSEEVRMPTVLQFSALRFGWIVDFEFQRSLAEGFATDGMLSGRPGELRFEHRAGNVLRFPEFPRPRYSLLNMRLKVCDTVLISGMHAGEGGFRLEYRTDLKPDDIRSEIFSLPADGSLGTAAVRLGGNFEEEERLLSLRLVAEGEGVLRLFRVRFAQGEDSLTPEEQAFFDHVPAAESPYAFTISDVCLDVRDFGARGDGYTCDNSAFQNAIDEAHRAGGGRVFAGGGRDYVISHLRLKDGVELFIEGGSRLLQSWNPEDYPYPAAYGHDDPLKDCNWAHNFLVHNRPLLWAYRAERVRVTGGGSILCMDGGNDREAVGFPYWPEHCGGVIHCAPIGFEQVRGAEISDLSILRASTYHCFFSHCERVTVNRVKMYDVRCLSADGIGLAGSRKVWIHGCVLRTNDDGVTLCSFHDDPRAGGWWKAFPGGDNRVCQVEVGHCMLNSACGGGGKAIAFIPWGTDAADLSRQEISDIWVHDCVLAGGHSVGAWPDNPYHGRQPFDNTETDDFSPVKEVVLERNEYRNAATLACIQATSVRSDCGIRSACSPQNGGFSQGLSYWSSRGGVRAEKRGERPCANLPGGAVLCQGLFCPAGRHRFSFEVSGGGRVFGFPREPDEAGRHPEGRVDGCVGPGQSFEGDCISGRVIERDRHPGRVFEGECKPFEEDCTAELVLDLAEDAELCVGLCASTDGAVLWKLEER